MAAVGNETPKSSKKEQLYDWLKRKGPASKPKKAKKKSALTPEAQLKVQLEKVEALKQKVKAAKSLSPAARKQWLENLDNAVEAAKQQPAQDLEQALDVLEANSRESEHARLEGLDAVFKDAREQITAAAKKLQAVDGIGLVDVKAAAAQIRAANTALDAARFIEDVGPALLLLGNAEEQATAARKDKGNKEALASQKNYREVRAKIEKYIARAQTLRGAQTDPEQMALIGNAQAAIRSADEKVAAAQSIDEVQQAKVLLEKHDLLEEKAKARDKALKILAKADLAAVEAYQEAFRTLEARRAEYAGIEGVQIAGFDTLMVQTRIADGLGPQGGYAAALEKLTAETPALVEQAELDAKYFWDARGLENPGLTKARALADEALAAFKPWHPEFEHLAAVEAKALAERGADPIAKLDKLVKSWKASTQDAQARKKTVEGLVAQLQGERQRLAKVGLPEEQLAQLCPIDRVQGLADGLNFAQAEQLAGDVLEDCKLAPGEWPAKQSELLQACAKLESKWPQLATEIGDIRELAAGIGETLGAGGLSAAIAAAEGLLERCKTVDKRDAELTAELGDPASFDKALAARRAEVRQLMDAEIAKAEAALGRLDEALRKAGVEPKDFPTPAHKQLPAIEASCDKQLSLSAAEATGKPETLWQDALEETKASCESLIKSAEALAAEGPARNAVVESAKNQKEHKPLWLQLDAAIAKLTSMGQDTKAYRAMTGWSFSVDMAKARAGEWPVTLEKVNGALSAAEKDAAKRKAELQSQLGDLKKSVASRIKTHRRNFPGFFEEFDERLNDAEAMLDSDDPTLVAAGASEIALLKKTLADAKKGGDGARSFDEVRELWNELSALVGQIKYQPDTRKRLTAQLAAAVAKTKAGGPEAGWAGLEELRQPCADAVGLEEALGERHKLFEARVKQIEGALGSVRDHAKQGLLKVSAPAYEGQVQVRLAAAKAKTKLEGGLGDAGDMLAALSDELRAMLAMPPEAAHTKLKALDAAAAQEERELRDLVRAWKETVSSWKDQRLPAVKAAVIEARSKLEGAKNAAKSAVGKGTADATEYEDLKGAVGRAGAPVKAYVELAESKKPWGSKAVDMGAARSAFAEAHRFLRSLDKTAARLIDGEGSTNVGIESNLPKLNTDWQKRSAKASAKLDLLVKALLNLHAQRSEDQGDPDHYLDKAGLDALNQNVAKARTMVLALKKKKGGLLDPDAFEATLGQVADKSLDENIRLQAREAALRNVRVLRKRILSPFFQELGRGAAEGLLDVDVRGELGLLNASLKRIEISVLAAI